MSDLPVVCTLTPESLATRKAELLPRLVARTEAREDIADGLRVRLPPDALSDVLTTVTDER
jgi:hypothetical protein